ncbi:inner membrane protein [Candidatus Photodesmus katoptron]|uniref:cytochrome C assembly family protein n=1 Tax=Candidatus Photodesmus anomalopis TaxID=28176 RepID=UPI0004D8BCB1|nr:inner membrane protein YpjD [Candidatus Photodesmus katoptron]KEY90435.1 inner membrane protein [Candidatus Photodesmus katoptron]
MYNLIAIIAAVFYVFSTAIIILGLVYQVGVRSNVALISALLALVLHGFLVANLIWIDDGQNLSILNVALLVSFIISLVMSIAMLKIRLWFLLPFVYSFSVINLSLVMFLPSTFITHLENDPKILVHISLALFSYSTLTVGALYALQLNWLDYQLKAKKVLVINPNLPPLMMVERQLFKIISIGTILLTGTLLTGFIFVQDIFAQSKVHKGILSFIAWFIYSILLLGHYYKGWRGKKVAWCSVAGSIVLTLAYFGSRFILEIIL